METQPRSMNAELAAHACDGFGALYGSDRIPGDDKAAVFGVATRVTSSAMSGEYPGDAADVEALRRAASGAFVATMAHGVPATHRYASATRSLPEDWAAVADAFDAFVDFAAAAERSAAEGRRPSEPSDATLRRERDVLECADARVVAPQSASAPERVRERIVAALERGAATFPADPGPGPAADAGSEDSELGPSDDAGRYFAGIISEGAAKEAAGGSGKEAVGSLKERPHSFAYRCAGGLARLYGRSRRENAPAGAAAIGRLALFAAARFASATSRRRRGGRRPARYRGEVDAREASRLNARVALAEGDGDRDGARRVSPRGRRVRRRRGG